MFFVVESSPTRERTNSAPTISESASPPEINFDIGIDDLIDNIFNDEDKTTKANEKLDKLQYPAGKLHVSDDVLAQFEKIAARCEQNHLPPAGIILYSDAYWLDEKKYHGSNINIINNLLHNFWD